MTVTVKLEGFRELGEALGEFSKATGNNVMRRALLKGGEPIERAAEENVAVLTGRLKSGVKVSTKTTSRRRKQSEVEAYVGPDQDPAGIQNEFGNRHQAPQPFLRPAFDAKAGEALERIGEAMGEEIGRAAARAARKAARAAARG